MDHRPSNRTRLAAALVACLVLAIAAAAPASARVLRVGTFHGIRGDFRSIQSAVNAAHPGDWVLVAPGDYHEQGVRGAHEHAGVLIRKPRIHLRGLDRNRVIVDGTKRGSRPCSARARDQQITRSGRNGVVALKVSGVYIENLTVCNYLTGRDGDEANEIWWNGGDGSGRIGMGSWWGDYLTASSTFSRGPNPPFGKYGIFVSNARGPGKLDHSYASNMGDAAYYVGACPDCHATLVHAHGQFSALGYSGTNSGGHLVIERSEFDHNKSGPTTNSQNNDDAPSPQSGHCPGTEAGPLGDGICEIWRDNLIHDNNEPNVPGNGLNSLAGEIPVGTGAVLGGSEFVEVFRNRIYSNKAWGVAVADEPDQEGPNQLANCRGGSFLTAPSADPSLCYYQAFGNVVRSNTFVNNGGYANPTNGDIVLYAMQHDPGNCFTGNTNAAGLKTHPANLQSPPFSACGQPNGSTDDAALAQLGCALRLLPCPPGTSYPKAARSFRLHRPQRQPSMPNPCKGVPRNPWCPARR